ncbi:MAG TPA: hypothetical protein QGH10_00490 [Armatimonadota bacterium]|nr:hypothetical protein [Armatimonadota bacterium]
MRQFEFQSRRSAALQLLWLVPGIVMVAWITNTGWADPITVACGWMTIPWAAWDSLRALLAASIAPDDTITFRMLLGSKRIHLTDIKRVTYVRWPLSGTLSLHIDGGRTSKSAQLWAPKAAVSEFLLALHEARPDIPFRRGSFLVNEIWGRDLTRADLIPDALLADYPTVWSHLFRKGSE